MRFNSQICTTRSQSECLLALGLKKGTADMYYPMELDGGELPVIADAYFGCPKGTLPTWSLHRLIEIAQLPNDWQCISGNWYEEIIATIQSKIHIGELNKEYLEE